MTSHFSSQSGQCQLGRCKQLLRVRRQTASMATAHTRSKGQVYVGLAFQSLVFVLMVSSFHFPIKRHQNYNQPLPLLPLFFFSTVNRHLKSVMSGTIKTLGTAFLHSRLPNISHQPARPKKLMPTSSRASSSATPSPHFPNLFQQIREARSAVRYTVYAGLGLIATVETVFWWNVLEAKFFPSTSEGDNQTDVEFLERVKSAVKGYRRVWMSNYRRYYGAYLWGLGYGGLDGL